MIFAFGAHELDTRLYELRRIGRGAQPIEPQVFDVLAYLVQHRDRVVPKEELLDKLWPDRFVSETTLTSRIKAGRKAVGDTGKAQSIIRTYHGRGYRFVARVEEREPFAALVGCVTAEHVVRRLDEGPSASAVDDGRRAIASNAPLIDLTASFADAPADASLDHDDFVGRHDELAHLERALDRAARGTRQVVFVAGEAGAGKTTLIDTFLAARAGAPWQVARGQCVEHRGSGEPYMPLLDAVGRLCRDPGGAQVVDLLKRDAPSWLVQLPWTLPENEHAALVARTGAAGERMLREFGVFLERLTAEQPLILFLEDLHWSDHATLDVVDLLARRPRAARLLVLGTYRPSDVKATRHPMHAVVQELRVRGYCDVLPLPLLASKDLHELLARRFTDAPFSADLAPVLHARTGGNPLFAGHLIDSWVDRGLIRQSGGAWTLDASLDTLETDVPDSLSDFIEQQVADLDPDEQRLLEVASVLGRTFTVAALASTLPAADEDVEREAEALARAGRFLRANGTEPWGDGTLTARFAFTHDLFVDVIYQRIPTARRARLHQQAGQALERAWSGSEPEPIPRRHAVHHLVASQLALHFQRGLDRERGPRYLAAAAEHALERSAYREATSHLTAGLELLAGAPPSEERDRRELTMRCRLAPALIATRGYADGEVEQNYLRARELAERLGETTLLSQTLYGLANMYEYRGAYEVAERVTRERLHLDGAATRINLLESHELLTCSFLHQGKYRQSVEHGEKAMAAIGDERPLDGEQLLLVVQAHGWMSGSLFFAGRPDDALAHSAEALRLAEASGDDLAKASAAIQAAQTHFYFRHPEEAARLAEHGIAIARERRFPFHAAFGCILRGWSLSCAGQHEQAVAEIRSGISTCRAIGALMDVPVFLAMLSEPLAASGDRAGALACLDEAIGIVESGRTFFYAPELYRLRALLMLEMGGQPEPTVALLHKAIALAEAQGSPVFAARATESLNAIHAAAEVAPPEPTTARRSPRKRPGKAERGVA